MGLALAWTVGLFPALSAPVFPQAIGTPAPEPTSTATATPVPSPLPQEGIVRPKISHAGPPRIVPSAELAVAVNSSSAWHAGPSWASFPVWVGAAFHPVPEKASPFSALGLEMNFTQDPLTGVSYTEFVPEARLGIAGLRAPVRDFWNVAFPDVEGYAIAGWRLPNASEGGAARVGLGVSSPLLAVLGLSSGCRSPMPGMVELTLDLPTLAGGGARVWQARFGFEF